MLRESRGVFVSLFALLVLLNIFMTRASGLTETMGYLLYLFV